MILLYKILLIALIVAFGMLIFSYSPIVAIFYSVGMIPVVYEVVIE